MELIKPTWEEAIQRYNDDRLLNVRRKLCHAPFQNLYFGRDGKVTACCYNRTVILGQYPEQNLEEIWTGKVIQDFRAEMTANSFGTGCESCAEQLEAANFAGLHARLYDRYADAPLGGMYQKAAELIKAERPLQVLYKEWDYFKNKLSKLFSNRSFAQRISNIIRQEIKQFFRPRSANSPAENNYTSFPRALEFELSNICNLECAMCFGEFSSLIRKNRDQLPALPMYYDDAFVDQLEPFLPHLWDAKFFGGEPFLVPIYYDIWERMIQINPNTIIHITTNGTVLNEKVKRVLEKLNVVLILSIDSFEKETYEAIRKNANYDRVMENMKYFEKVAKEKQTLLNLAVCPMTLNWREIPRIVQYCNEKEIYIYFNTVWYPYELSIRSLSTAELKEVNAFYDTFSWSKGNNVENHNITAFQSYVNQVKKWQEMAIESETASVLEKRRISERIEALRQANPIFNAIELSRIEQKNNNYNYTDNQMLNTLALQAESAENFIFSYFETLCEGIESYSDKPDNLLLEIRKSNVRTLCEHLLTQLNAEDIIKRILENDHAHTAKYIIQMHFDEEKNPAKIFASTQAV